MRTFTQYNPEDHKKKKLQNSVKLNASKYISHTYTPHAQYLGCQGYTLLILYYKLTFLFSAIRSSYSAYQKALSTYNFLSESTCHPSSPTRGTNIHCPRACTYMASSPFCTTCSSCKSALPT